ncbi:protein THEMIS2 [Rhineura floridana]|uniref:protein THEMIS2 n=1 Tax=Rhineura floridana TaxID=261503 RepID=UPI002AC7FDE9|nr:protein THEMIS2 [Rhineura floridana]
MESVSFHQYICDLDRRSLPRVVKICSGVYFQGSVYEISGNECCLSTGDLMKIVDVQLQNVTCKNVENGHIFELPLDFKGLFHPSPRVPYEAQGEPFPLGSPFRKYNFFQCHQPQSYTLQEVLQSAAIRWKRLKCPEIGKSEFQLYPMYKVEAIMHFRNDVVKINSTLDVEVVDVTKESGHIHFIKPLMLSEVLAMETVLPVEAEILGAPERLPVFQSKWVCHLQKGCRIHIHSKGSSLKILASSHKGKNQTCHFLISSSYKGLFRRCPRKFSSTSELVLSLATGKKLQVVVTKECESSEGEFSLLSVGDRLEVLSLVRASDPSTTDVLLCCRDNGDEDREQIHVPLFLDAGFVEDVRDNRKYTLSEAAEHLQLPCEVKVVSSDYAPDPPGCFSVLTLEAQIKLPFLNISLAKEPTLTFDIPPQWLDMSVFFTRGPPKVSPPTSSSMVEELTEAFYYHLLKLLPSNAPAPPRPPKQKDSKLNMCPPKVTEGEKDAAETSKLPSRKSNSASQGFAKCLFSEPKQISTNGRILMLNNPNLGTIKYEYERFQKPSKPREEATGTTFNADSDNDYEEVDSEVHEMACKLQRAAIKH